MRDKINQLIQEDFNYSLPDIVVSQDKIDIKIQPNKVIEGVLRISNSFNTSMKGIVFSSNSVIQLVNNTFYGVDNLITYHIFAKHLCEGDNINAYLTIVTDIGEKEIPFVVSVELDHILSSIGKINDLKKFVGLAKLDWLEAKNIFKSKDFSQMLLSKNQKQYELYHHIIQGNSTSKAIEEFLVALGFKEPIRIYTEPNSFHYNYESNKVDYKIKLRKSTWGYEELSVATDAPFIELHKKILWTDEFENNRNELSFNFLDEYIRNGRNYGSIYIKSSRQLITIHVVCEKLNINKSAGDEARELKKSQFDYISNYLQFRIGNIGLSRYISNIYEIISSSSGNMAESRTYDLLRAYAGIVSGDKNTEFLMEQLKLEEEKIKNYSVIEHGIYLYLTALYHRDKTVINAAAEQIEKYFRKNFDWRLLWALLYLKDEYKNNPKLRLSKLIEEIKHDCNSPIFYFEALKIYNSNPSYFMDLSNENLQIINFGIKHNYISMDLMRQFVYLASKAKVYNEIIFKSLCKLYDTYELDDILYSICSISIRGHKQKNKYFKYYELGVRRQLRITELYEYYMYSLDHDLDKLLPSSVLNYFLYESKITDSKKAYLYGNILKNTKIYEKQYDCNYFDLYKKKISTFIYQQLEAGRIDENLGFLYDHFIHSISKERGEILELLTPVIFRNQLACSDLSIKTIQVYHLESDFCQQVNLNDNKAYVDIYTDNYQIYFINENGNKIVTSVPYEITRLLQYDEYLSKITVDYDHEMLIVNKLYTSLLREKYDYDLNQFNASFIKNPILEDEIRILIKMAIRIETLNKKLKNNLILLLIYDGYNCNKYDGDHLLESIDIELLSKDHREKMIEIMIHNELYELAGIIMKEYGVPNISMKALRAWVLYGINNDMDKDIISEIAIYLFKLGDYNDDIIRYLSEKYYGPIETIYALWKVSHTRFLNSDILAEKFIVQSLFTEECSKETVEVFVESVDVLKKEKKIEIIRAFLSYYSYLYLNDRILLSKRVFMEIKEIIHYYKSDVCTLAYLKYLTSVNNNQMIEDEKEFIEYNIHKFYDQGIILPFFKEFEGIIESPGNIYEKEYIEYRANPAHKVFIHYRINHGEIINEHMEHIIAGIHIKELRLFYGENLQYYFTEEIGGEVKDSKLINMSSKNLGKLDSKYNQINEILKSIEEGNEERVYQLMKKYAVDEYIMSQAIKPL